jgi:peroxiredoxin
VTSDDVNAKKFLAEKGITFRTLKSDWQTAGKLYGVNGTPANFVIDQDGRILFVHRGFRGPKSVLQMEGQIQAVLDRPAPAASR